LSYAETEVVSAIYGHAMRADIAAAGIGLDAWRQASNG
jgi:hypothetical protein